MNNVYSYTRDELVDYFLSIGEKKFKADQLFDWLYKKRCNNFDEMINLNKNVISHLKNDMCINSITILKKETGENVIKYLFSLFDGEKIEAVLMFHDYGISLCISTQVGCNMACAFCESGRLKKRRNLMVCEMVLQILKIEDDINKRISHIVLMGIGEPFDNFDVLKRFISVITCPYGLEIGQRHITVSTCGLVPKIKEFASLNTQVNLAISLHAGSDEVRNKLMNINRVYPIKDVFDALDFYISKTNRRVTIEYILIDGINDSEKDALDLVSLVKGKLMYVNLIPYNETSNFTFKRSNEFKINKFYDILKKNGINVITRKNIAGGINAACGQLRAKESA